MNFTNKLKEPAQPSKRPIILCDVSGTLIIGEKNPEPNQELITLLNWAEDQGFEVKICMAGIGVGVDLWERYDKPRLQRTNLSAEIIATARGKDIGVDTFSGVVAIIDDDPKQLYIRMVTFTNPGAEYFQPHETERLIRHLNTIKSRNNLISP